MKIIRQWIVPSIRLMDLFPEHIFAQHIEELFKVKGEQFHRMLFRRDDDILHVLLDAEKRTRFYVVILAIRHQGLNRLAGWRIPLNLVKHKARPARNQPDTLNHSQSLDRILD